MRDTACGRNNISGARMLLRSFLGRREIALFLAHSLSSTFLLPLHNCSIDPPDFLSRSEPLSICSPPSRVSLLAKILRHPAAVVWRRDRRCAELVDLRGRVTLPIRFARLEASFPHPRSASCTFATHVPNGSGWRSLSSNAEGRGLSFSLSRFRLFGRANWCK